MKNKIDKIEGVILDWAGTTVDFGCFAPVNVFLEIFKNAEIFITTAEARAPMGMLKRDHIKAILEMPRISEQWIQKYGRSFDEIDVDNLYADFEPLIMKSLSDFTTPIPEVLDAVDLLKKQGLMIGSTTGYTDSMMEVVVKGAEEKGYSPDFWVTPDSTNSFGRPYPYMIYRNMEELKLSAAWKVVKAGDTLSDIKEAVNAGVWSVGVVIGSSEMGLGLEEFSNLSDVEKGIVIRKTEECFLEAGADFTIKTMKELPKLIDIINGQMYDGKRPNAR